MSVRQEERRDSKTGATRKFWMVDFLFEHADGRVQRVRKVSRVQTKRGAEEYERQLRAALLNPTATTKEVPTFKTFVVDRWWNTYPVAAGNRHSTIREKEFHLKCHLTPFFENVVLDRIKQEMIARFIATLSKEKGLRPKRIKNILATLRKILVSAQEWEVIAEVPKFPKVKTIVGAFDFFVREESDRCIAAARDPEEDCLLMFPFHTGARAGEQLALRWADIDWTKREVVFRQSSTNGIVGPTKSGKERRVPMTNRLEAALKGMPRHGELVFCKKDGSPLTLWMLHERLWGACRRAGLRKIRWHDTRHSFASQLVTAGVPLRLVQEWLGHGTITMTMTMRYAHLAPGGGREHLSALEGNARGHGSLLATDYADAQMSA